MKKLKQIIIGVFLVLLCSPLIFFNWKKDAVSEIDNRKLTENPFKRGMPFNQETIAQAENFLADRVGFRNFMIKEYTVFNDKVFHEMVHPSYEYGKNGYVFFKYGSCQDGKLTDYEITFAKTIRKMQDYCEQRGVPFLFVFNPSKLSICSDQVADGYNFNRKWVPAFMKELDTLGVHYIDNSSLLEDKYRSGETVFNVKFNAGHWNDLGAFYGVNHIAEEIKKSFPDTHVNKKDEYNVEDVLRISLLVSDFPIHETEPRYTLKKSEKLIYKDQGDLQLNEHYPYFRHVLNPMRNRKSPKILCFQGSYMNGMGYKFMENITREYIAIHDYQNVLELPYYFEKFHPDYVVFETAEYTFSDKYYSLEKMKSIKW